VENGPKCGGQSLSGTKDADVVVVPTLVEINGLVIINQNPSP
jgi:hypothetical protein